MGRTVTFLFELVFGFLTYVLLIIISVVSKGVTFILNIGYDFEGLFGFSPYKFMPAVTGIAGVLMLLGIMYDIAKGYTDIEDKPPKSAAHYLKSVIIAFVLLQILPLIINLWQLLSDGFILFLSRVIGNVLDDSINTNGGFQILINAAEHLVGDSASVAGADLDVLGKFIVTFIFLIVMLLGTILIGVSLMKRYVELLIAMMISPYIATTVYVNYDKINTWLSRISQIFVGYMLNVLLLYVMFGMSASFLDPDVTLQDAIAKLFLLAALVLTAVGGSSSIKEYIVSTNTGSQVQSMSQTAMMRFTMRRR